MVIKGFLPKAKTDLFCDRTLKLFYNARYRRGELCSPALYYKDQMNVVWHHNVLIDPHVFVNTI